MPWSSSEEAAVINRDEYVQKLKSQIDQWTAEGAKWEAKAKEAQAGMKGEYERQLEQFRARRDAAVAELRRVQNATADAWTEMMRGADAAMKSMQEAFDRTRQSFDRKTDKS
jgi:lipid II:glycine glycyltransferase (peptidoglycan interpeptide bridge formation enzyme)